jgi:hypothetical protein
MINTQIRQFRDSIIAMTNACQLPIEIKRLVFAEIQTQINSESERIIIAEKEQQKNAPPGEFALK